MSRLTLAQACDLERIVDATSVADVLEALADYETYGNQGNRGVGWRYEDPVRARRLRQLANRLDMQ